MSNILSQTDCAADAIQKKEDEILKNYYGNDRMKMFRDVIKHGTPWSSFLSTEAKIAIVHACDCEDVNCSENLCKESKDVLETVFKKLSEDDFES